MQRSKSSLIRPVRPLSSGLSLLCLGMLAASAHAASINFVGTETGAAVQNWSYVGVPKTPGIDIDNNNRFGSAGYYQITPGAVGNSWSDAAEANNNLGITQIYPTLFSKPDFLNGNPLGAEGSYSNPSTAPDFMNPEGNALIRQGGLAPSSGNIEFVFTPDDVEGVRHVAFSFTLSESANFRLGIAVDTSGVAADAPDYVYVSNVTAGDVFSTPLIRNGVPDMVFFDIQGNAGDVFVVKLFVKLIQENEELPVDGPIPFSLITFDQQPVPTLSYSLDGNNFTLSWEPEISGWTLESSTDLGGNDDWAAVTEPEVVNNSVTLNITGTPKNFFRLRKDP